MILLRDQNEPYVCYDDLLAYIRTSFPTYTLDHPDLLFILQWLVEANVVFETKDRSSGESMYCWLNATNRNCNYLRFENELLMMESFVLMIHREDA